MPIKISMEVRAFALGLLLGAGGMPYSNKEIAKLVEDRFGKKISAKTIKNWNYDIPAQMERHQITDEYIKEVVARVLVGDLRKKEIILADDEEPLVEIDEKTRETTRLETAVGGALKFNTIAEMISYCEQQGFKIAKNDGDLITMVESMNKIVIDADKSLIGLENLFVEDMTLDIETVGRNIISNPVIGMYYAIENRYQKSRNPELKQLDLVAWATTCIVEFYNHLYLITKGARKSIVLSVITR